ncbi:zinc-dependent metalloprotease [Robiginitalea sp. M366]|uniref:zinc-dependent metalloprotease n=1 Tax=Robiginitalea aestuariiviva TaxID=3036903 RepID=UPI00240DFFA5|nr:zinc-dependent metalloprotease [Robiginitalea aestuariiviva]MDG1571548.1 zinc-dependent metalloprotease [Robiginitalea aestuariiviva]
MRIRAILAGVALLSFSATAWAQKGADAGADKKKDKTKKYEEVITDAAVTDEGFITTHKVDDKYYFEIPQDLFEKEILIVSRIAGYVKDLSFGGAGMKSRPQQVIRFQQRDNRVLLRSVSYNSVASEEDPVYRSVRNNNFEPVVENFEVSTYGPDSTVVVDVTGFFTSDIPMIGALSDRQRKNFKIKNLDKGRSMITSMKSYPKNLEVRHILTYNGDELPDNRLTGTLSLEMNQSLILLPEDPWMPRLHDERVGFFSVRQTNYSLDEQRAANKRYITRWRLEPKDKEAYMRGELVEPVKPIVYYLDPGTPPKWAPYIKKGVEDWQKAFEKAGFKNAIIAKDAPTPEEDPEWSPEDVRYSVIRYITTEIQNAQGPHVHDPRTGEILESDILWYHNVMNLLRNWYFVQTAAVNPDAQGYKFKDEVMGELIRFVSAHEVGHTLGFPHNMGSSPAYPVDSLRSRTFTDTHGTAPSIMDYARFNYIAQPEDGVQNLHPQIGEYDDWAIMYGYKLNLEAETPEADKKILNTWIEERAGDPALRFGRLNGIDPSSQTEDLGDDAVYASQLGVANLQRIVPALRKYTTENDKDYDDLREMYGQVYGQFRRYIGHVGRNVGGVYEQTKYSDQEGEVYAHVPRARQQAAVGFMNQYVFATPTWLLDASILNRIEDEGVTDRVRGLQIAAMRMLFDGARLVRVMENEALNGAEAYSMVNLFGDVRRGIFSEFDSGRQVDPYRRNLQRTFVDQMKDLMAMEDGKMNSSDIKAVARGTLSTLKKDLEKAASRYRDQTSKFHVQDLVARIDNILDPQD